MKHLVQTKEWSDFKNIYGTISLNAGNVFFTLHKIPFLNKYVAYCPKVNPFDIDFEDLTRELIKYEVIAINFDSPNTFLDSPNSLQATKILEDYGCTLSPRNTYPGATIFLDISKDEEDILKNFHSKHRYNLNLAKKKSLEISFDINKKTLEDFYFLQKLTSERQGYIIKPKEYYDTLVNTFDKRNKALLVSCYLDKEILASWLFIISEDTAYYVYGGSDDKYKNLFPSTLVLWESIIKLKNLGVKTIDLFGATEDLNNQEDPYYGFTIFKLRFGGTHKKFIKSYDLVLSPLWYFLFNLAQEIRWKILTLKN